MEKLIGHSRILDFLKNACDQDRLANLLLFSGKEGIGKKLMAKKLARDLLCENDDDRQKFDKGYHSDYHLYEPEGKLGLHSVDSMRQLCKEVYLYPNEAKRKLFIIDEVDRMLPVSANALLKTFEEPAENSTIIIISAHPERLLPTIISRCQRILFQPLNKDDLREILNDKVPEVELETLIKQAHGSASEAFQIWNEGKTQDKNPLIDILSGKYQGHYLHFKEALQKLLEKANEQKTESQEIELTAFQKLQLKKSQEGAQSMKSSFLIDRFFKDIIYWYRDLHLLKETPKLSENLYNKASQKNLESILNSNLNIPDIEDVMEYIQDARNGVQRAIKHDACLETLCLKLALV